jgi:hypothetical protein
MQFSIPTYKWKQFARLRDGTGVETNGIRLPWKIRDFARIVPGDRSTYIHNDEGLYLKEYASSYYGLSTKKAGWDCLRHYEILLAGTIPFIPNIQKIPPGTMQYWPLALVKKAMHLPGVPSDDEVIDFVSQKHAIWVSHSSKKGAATAAFAESFDEGNELRIDHTLFPVDEYRAIREQLLQYVQLHMLSKHMAAHILNIKLAAMAKVTGGADNAQNKDRPLLRRPRRRQQHGLRVLVHGRNTRYDGEYTAAGDYQHDLLIVGLLENCCSDCGRGEDRPGNVAKLCVESVTTTVDVAYLFDDFPLEQLKGMYGMGFTYTRSVPVAAKSCWKRQHLVLAGTSAEYDVYVKTTMSGHDFPREDLVLATSVLSAPTPETGLVHRAVDHITTIYIDGNDQDTRKDVSSPKAQSIDAFFRRELNSTRCRAGYHRDGE